MWKEALKGSRWTKPGRKKRTRVIARLAECAWVMGVPKNKTTLWTNPLIMTDTVCLLFWGELPRQEISVKTFARQWLVGEGPELERAREAAEKGSVPGARSSCWLLTNQEFLHKLICFPARASLKPGRCLHNFCNVAVCAKHAGSDSRRWWSWKDPHVEGGPGVAPFTRWHLSVLRRAIAKRCAGAFGFARPALP